MKLRAEGSGSGGPQKSGTCVALFANTDWYLFNFRLPLARALVERSGAHVLVVCPDGPYRPRLEQEGFTWVPVRLARQGLNPFRDLAEAWRLSRRLRPWKPALLHAFTLKSIVIGAFAARWGGIPRIVCEVTGVGALFKEATPVYRVAGGLIRRLFRGLARSSRCRLVFQHPGDQEVLFPERGSGTRSWIIPGSGVDTERFHPRQKAGGPRIVMLVGRLLRSKGITCFCEAARRVSLVYPDTVFRVVGAPDPGNPAAFSEEELRLLAQTHPQVAFLGHRSDMVELYGEASLVVLASHYEGVPRTLTEAAAAGLPLVATALPGVQGLVVDGRNGYQVPLEDPEAMAEAIQRLLSDDTLRVSMGSESRRIAEEEFSLGHVLERTFACYAELGFPPRGGGS